MREEIEENGEKGGERRENREVKGEWRERRVESGSHVSRGRHVNT